MDKSALLYGQTESSPWPENGLGVISDSFWRQLQFDLASIKQSIDANTHDWSHRETVWPQVDLRFATGGFEICHRTDRPLIGEGIDFDGRRNGLAAVTEMFGALSPRVKALHPPKGGRLQSVSPSPRQNPG